ncbi:MULTISPECIES: SecY-interacting protein [Rahnella]|uniref:SecY-interacting protein n=1 Tax=Rahnella TaxID=34037 RepID=UPI0007003474|nr:SecY-interacting protein [Rahnella rivi]KQN48442.1 secretion protein [Serratia sp. Leaf51]MBU9830551.1 SecY-interacting protein [Rahnella rivi]
MESEVSVALREFTQRYVDLWQRETGMPPSSEALLGVESPCIVKTDEDKVFWLTQIFSPDDTLQNVERAMELQLRHEAHVFYTTQFAGDMTAQWQGNTLTLLQVWSPEDFTRLQENLIGHLVTQKRLKLTPSVFLATTDSELDLVSLCNVTGNVILEQFGSKKRTILSPSLSEFLTMLTPVYPA